MGNNPVAMVDPDGKFAFVPFLVILAKAAVAGAAIGAGSSAVVYTATALASGNFDWGQFGKSVAFGAISGAIGSGIGGAFANSAFAQTVGFSIINNTASIVAGTAILGGDITGGTILGGVAGGLIGSRLPRFSGVKGGALANIGAEIGYNAGRGGITGAVSGGVSAAIDRRDIGQGISQGSLIGAVGGAALGAVNVGLFGPAYVPERTYGDFGKYKPIYRKGTFITRALSGDGSGVALGRNLITHNLDEDRVWTLNGENINPADFNEYLRAHETGHYVQQIKMGFGGFYGSTVGQYLKYGLSNVYRIYGTLEYGANRYSLSKLGYYYYNGRRYTR